MSEVLALLRWRDSPLWMRRWVWVCLSLPVCILWPHCWPLVRDVARRRLPIRPQPAEQGDDLLSPAWGREERVQVRESSPSGPSGSRKRPKRQAGSGEKMGDQALWVECPWEAWSYLGKGPVAGMTRGSVCHWWDARAQSCLGLHFQCKEYAAEPPSDKREKRFNVPRAPPPAPPAPTRRPWGERQPNMSQRNVSTSMAQVPKWRWVKQTFLSESKSPPHTEERPKPALDCESKTNGHPTLPILTVSQLCRPAWPRSNTAGSDESRPASEMSGAVGKLSSPS